MDYSKFVVVYPFYPSQGRRAGESYRKYEGELTLLDDGPSGTVTLEAPPKTGANSAAVRNLGNTAWDIVDDYEGAVLYHTETKEELRGLTLGQARPEQYTLLPPPPHAEWAGADWAVDAGVKRDADLAEAKEAQRYRIATARAAAEALGLPYKDELLLVAPSNLPRLEDARDPWFVRSVAGALVAVPAAEEEIFRTMSDLLYDMDKKQYELYRKIDGYKTITSVLKVLW